MCQIAWQNGLKHKSCPIPPHDKFCRILVDSYVIVNLIKVECDSQMYRYWGSICGQHLPVWNFKWKWCSKISKGRSISVTLHIIFHDGEKKKTFSEFHDKLKYIFFLALIVNCYNLPEVLRKVVNPWTYSQWASSDKHVYNYIDARSKRCWLVMFENIFGYNRGVNIMKLRFNWNKTDFAVSVNS